MEAANKRKTPLPNRLGILGWAWAGHYKMERYLYTLHRITGFGLLFYVTLHLAMNGFRLGGEEHWKDIMDLFSTPIFKVGEYLVMAAFIIHALNGGRLILQHLGITLGKPKPPIYPYVDAMRRRRPLTWGMIVLIAALAIYVLVEFIREGVG
jgi:succinate dehydrogenase / fumarate reductase cytochrome b subunit